jgi:hypothetical protein
MAGKSGKQLSLSSPTVLEHHSCTQACNHLVGRYPGWWMQPPSPSQASVKHSVAVMEAESWRFVHLPLRGQRRLGGLLSAWTLLLPVELRRVNHVASTNGLILTTDFALQRHLPTWLVLREKSLWRVRNTLFYIASNPFTSRARAQKHASHPFPTAPPRAAVAPAQPVSPQRHRCPGRCAPESARAVALVWLVAPG